jgi:homoserine/homoserine lactone efflux protein
VTVPDAYAAYVLQALAIALVPGPTLSVIIGNSLRYGKRAGMLNVFGTVTAGITWVIVAALGLSAAVAVLGAWFDVLRYVGASYLLWLAWKLFTSDGSFSVKNADGAGDANFFLQAFLVTISNPKVLLLFGAIIPPYLSRDGDTAMETLLLGGTFVAIAFITDICYALLASQAGKWMSRSRIRTVEIVSGAFLAGGAVWMLLRGRA